MNVTDFIFRLLHIYNLPTLFILTPLHFPCTPFTDCAHLSVNYKNTLGDSTDFSVDYAHNYNDCANIRDDRTNIVFDSVDTLDISSFNFCIPNLALLQLLLIYKSKIKIVFIVKSMIYFLSLTFFMYGFCISHPSFVLLYVKIHLLNFTCTLFTIYLAFIILFLKLQIPCINKV
jgi:hypothetical protein